MVASRRYAIVTGTKLGAETSNNSTQRKNLILGFCMYIIIQCHVHLLSKIYTSFFFSAVANAVPVECMCVGMLMSPCVCHYNYYIATRPYL